MGKDFIEDFAKGQAERRTSNQGYLSSPRQVTNPPKRSKVFYFLPYILIVVIFVIVVIIEWLKSL